MPIREKKHRLREPAYWGEKTVSFTACVLRRAPLFQDGDTVETFAAALARWAEEKSCIVPVYCFMPDHLHALVKGVDPKSRPKQCFDGFKQTTSNWLAENKPRFPWQKNYHDHIIRGRTIGGCAPRAS